MFDKEMIKYLGLALAIGGEIVSLSTGGFFLGIFIQNHFNLSSNVPAIIGGAIGLTAGCMVAFKHYEKQGNRK